MQLVANIKEAKKVFMIECVFIQKFVRMGVFYVKGIGREKQVLQAFLNRAVSCERLREFINIGRLTVSSVNRQPVRYILSCEPNKNEDIFKCLRWAGYLEDWDGPQEGERPVVYIVMVEFAGVNVPHDKGIIGQTILFAAAEQGLGRCFLTNIDRENLWEVLNVNDK